MGLIPRRHPSLLKIWHQKFWISSGFSLISKDSNGAMPRSFAQNSPWEYTKISGGFLVEHQQKIQKSSTHHHHKSRHKIPSNFHSDMKEFKCIMKNLHLLRVPPLHPPPPCPPHPPREFHFGASYSFPNQSISMDAWKRNWGREWFVTFWKKWKKEIGCCLELGAFWSSFRIQKNSRFLSRPCEVTSEKSEFGVAKSHKGWTKNIWLRCISPSLPGHINVSNGF